MARCTENTGSIYRKCNKTIEKLTNGSYRNHCPFCLYSRHVDNHPGDRENTCRGLMKPAGLGYKPKKGWQLIHCCLKCGAQVVNKVAVETVQPDDPWKLGML